MLLDKIEQIVWNWADKTFSNTYTIGIIMAEIKTNCTIYFPSGRSDVYRIEDEALAIYRDRKYTDDISKITIVVYNTTDKKQEIVTIDKIESIALGDVDNDLDTSYGS